MGEDELNQDKIMIKNMETKEQNLVDINSIISEIKKNLQLIAYSL